jgi:hypothetical protein
MPEGHCFNQTGSEIFIIDVTKRRADNLEKQICHEDYRADTGFVLRGVLLFSTV